MAQKWWSGPRLLTQGSMPSTMKSSPSGRAFRRFSSMPVMLFMALESPVPPMASPVTSSSSVSCRASTWGERSRYSAQAIWHHIKKPVEPQTFETSAMAWMAPA